MVDLEVTLLIPEADDANHGVAVDYKGVEFWIITATPHANEPGPIIHSSMGQLKLRWGFGSTADPG